MITGTVALPVWNSKRIVWLAMESLCRQQKPIGDWELIIFEEKHPQQIGEQYFRRYQVRLYDVGCKRIVYLTAPKWIPLSQKWVIMANASDPKSKYFCLCGADDYSQSRRLIETEHALSEVDWMVTPKGYFYDFYYDKVIAYNINTLTGMQMAVNTELARAMPIVNKNCGVDGWYVKSALKIARQKKGQLKCYMSCSENWKQILCTNGLNNISRNRTGYFKDVQPPFYPTNVKLSEIVPADIYYRLMSITKSLKVNDDLG